MEDCCASSGCNASHPKKRRCPADGRECAEVPVRTILHHIKESWAWEPTASIYYFCDDPACDVVYFGDDDAVIPRSRLRTPVGVKESGGDAPLCYCFGVSRADFARDPAIKDFVIAQTRAGACSCDTRNPSGRCCLKDFAQG